MAVLLRRRPVLHRARRPVARIRFCAPPSRFFAALGSFRPPVPHAPRHVRAAVLHLVRPWSLSVRAPPDAIGSPTHAERHSWDFFPYGTLSRNQSGCSRGFHTSAASAHRVSTLATAYSRPRLAKVRRPPQRPWGCPFRALLPPTCGTPLGASPLLPFPGPTRRRGRRDFRGLSRIGKGKERPDVLEIQTTGVLTLPSWVFAPPRLSPPVPEDRKRSKAPPSLRPKMLPTVPLSGGDTGDCVYGNRLVSLETAGLPGVSHLLASRASSG